MAIKIDLKKTYDRLNWNFIKDPLEDVGIPNNIIKLIHECITSARMCLLWNGRQTDSFSPSRGICRGDPISPYLFVLCIERLSHLINILVEHNIWHPSKVTRSGPRLSYLYFANDIILFAKASIDQVRVIKGVLDLFCSSSGQKVNQNKSCVFFSKNVCLARHQELSDLLGFHLTSNLRKYLGVPLLHERSKTSDFQFIIDHMIMRLNGW